MSVSRSKLKIIIAIAFVLLLSCFLLISAVSLYSTSLIDERVQGFALGFYQHDYLAKTSSYLHKGESEQEIADSLQKAYQNFDGFLTVAPVKTASGIQKTNQLKAAIDNVKAEPNAANIAVFDKLAMDFRELILKYDVQGTKNSVNDAYRFTMFVIFAILIIFLILSIVFYRLLRNEFMSVTNRIKENIRYISQGDLTGKHSGSYEDINGIHHELDGMRGSLTTIASSIKLTSSRINNIAREVANGNENLSARTEEQASSLQQTAASMEQIKTTVAHNTDNARQANELASRANVVAQKGASIMSLVIESMQKIEQSARQIAEINSVINGIANQTNILALNAAVEAARAGTQGRGFAVVASEVRNLARRSAEAAEEIGSLIQGAMVNVSEGTMQVSGAGNAMKDIVSSIMQVSNIMKEITNASVEQSIGINQVASALNGMDNVTQQNATLVEESSAIALEMDVQAKKLADIVTVFTVDEENAR